MAETAPNQFTPDYAVPPGETLLETLDSIGMTQAELADRTGRPRKTINGIIRGKTQITPDTALQLERALGVPASLWMNLEAQYQEIVTREEERRALENEVDWIKQFPVTEMVKRGWIQKRDTKVGQIRELLTFFGVASPGRWREVWANMPVSFRKSPAYQADPAAVAAWLRRGELEAQRVEVRPFDDQGFKQALGEIRALTTEPPSRFVPAMHDMCRNVGVVVLFIRELPRIRAWGATRWISPDKALIQLTIRYRTDDHLWFSFYHEAGHILIHGKKEVFLEDGDSGNGKEQQANDFAEKFLIPRQLLKEFMIAGAKSKGAIRRFAAEIGIAPGIVVGQLQHYNYLPMSHCNDLKRKFEWVDESA